MSSNDPSVPEASGIAWRYAALLTVVAAAIVVVSLLDPIPQDPAYHAFADQRNVLGVPNFWNVVSNTPFLAAGFLGLVALRRTPDPNRAAYGVFFAAAILIAFGSGYYHLAPGNAALVWDRLPMTVAFMSFSAILVGERIDSGVGRRLLPFLIVIGPASVLYWHATESNGHGDLRPYVLVQFVPLLLLVLVLLLFPRAGAPNSLLWSIFVLYAIAKAAEMGDAAIFRVSGFVSGHTLKHLLGGAATACLLVALRRRRTPRPTHPT